MEKRNLLHASVFAVILWSMCPVTLEAKGASGKAVIPADLTSRQEVFDACQDMILDAGYAIETIDSEAGLISASKTSSNIMSHKTKYTYTWNISVRAKDQEQVTEVRMTRGTHQTFVPKDVDKLFVYLFEAMDLDLSRIMVTIDGETRPATEWKGKKKKRKKKKSRDS